MLNIKMYSIKPGYIKDKEVVEGNLMTSEGKTITVDIKPKAVSKPKKEKKEEVKPFLISEYDPKILEDLSKENLEKYSIDVLQTVYQELSGETTDILSRKKLYSLIEEYGKAKD